MCGNFAVQKVAGDNVTVEIRNILKEVDRNGDGRIDYEEFCDMMRQVGIFISTRNEQVTCYAKHAHEASDDFADNAQFCCSCWHYISQNNHLASMYLSGATMCKQSLLVSHHQRQCRTQQCELHG